VHAEIRREGGTWFVVDHNSRNGTSLNGRLLHARSPLASGDRIQIGSTTLVFQESPESGESVGPRHDSARETWRNVSGDEEPLVFLGDSPRVRELLETVDRIAPSPVTVLITGETATGKQMIAQRMHARSPRSDGPFVAVNCPALPGSLLEAELFGVEGGVATGVERRAGKFEAAQRGTLFLDEVGDMDGAAQAKIRRVLQEKVIERVGGRTTIPLDVRIVAATHHDLEADVTSGSFRRDLYHRLNVLRLNLPPLRERTEDIPILVRHFLGRPGPEVSIDDGALALLIRHAWPGNVRELAHVLERSRHLARGPSVRIEDLPDEIRSPETAPRTSEASAARLYDRIVSGGESFWEVVHGPYLRRELSREEARCLVARAHAECGGSYKGVARLFRIEAEHKKLLNFLRNHGLGVS
jgi:transcriptional regulator with PAS, ATPase and Fis domain